jgi:hypothetical protein
MSTLQQFRRNPKYRKIPKPVLIPIPNRFQSFDQIPIAIPTKVKMSIPQGSVVTYLCRALVCVASVASFSLPINTVYCCVLSRRKHLSCLRAIGAKLKVASGNALSCRRRYGRGIGREGGRKCPTHSAATLGDSARNSRLYRVVCLHSRQFIWPISFLV